ncbi:IS5 family transposase [Ochrobactrum sp. S46]|nr:IS5 family transposase [Ochrobactrum sp. S45]MBK0046205.1 IS5 family transposase [Ochrobactrum sp. S46]
MAMLETLAELVERDRSTDMIDSTIVRAHHCAVGTKRVLKRSRRLADRVWPTTKLHARCDAQGRPLGFVLTPAQTHDSQGFTPLFRMISDRVEAFLADKGYDDDAIREEIASDDIEAVISAKSNRRDPIPHDRAKYKWRNQIERLFNKLKNWPRVATRYDKAKGSYLGFVAAAVKLWNPLSTSTSFSRASRAEVRETFSRIFKDGNDYRIRLRSFRLQVSDQKSDSERDRHNLSSRSNWRSAPPSW